MLAVQPQLNPRVYSWYDHVENASELRQHNNNAPVRHHKKKIVDRSSRKGEFTPKCLEGGCNRQQLLTLCSSANPLPKVVATDEKWRWRWPSCSLGSEKEQSSITLSLHRNPSCYDLCKRIRARAQLKVKTASFVILSSQFSFSATSINGLDFSIGTT